MAKFLEISITFIFSVMGILLIMVLLIPSLIGHSLLGLIDVLSSRPRN